MTSPEPAVPPQAITAEVLARMFHETYERLAPSHGYETRKASAVPWDDVPEPNRNLMIAVAGEVLEAAAPHLAAAERAKLADRQQMVDEVKAELDDAFQFAERDGSHHSYVTREWVQVLIATQAASAAAAEAERCAQLAESLKFRLYRPAKDGPGGGVQALDVIPASELLAALREGGEGGTDG